MKTIDNLTDKNFESLFKKAKRICNYEDFGEGYLSIDDYNRKLISKMKLYTTFVNLTRKFVNLEEEETINIWHIEQNEIETDKNLKISIKNLCMHYFYNLQSEIDYLEKTKKKVL